MKPEMPDPDPKTSPAQSAGALSDFVKRGKPHKTRDLWDHKFLPSKDSARDNDTIALHAKFGWQGEVSETTKTEHSGTVLGGGKSLGSGWGVGGGILQGESRQVAERKLSFMRPKTEHSSLLDKHLATVQTIRTFYPKEDTPSEAKGGWIGKFKAVRSEQQNKLRQKYDAQLAEIEADLARVLPDVALKWDEILGHEPGTAASTWLTGAKKNA